MIFDLWDTLALWPSEAFAEVVRRFREYVPDLDRVWNETYEDRQVQPLEDYFRSLGLEGDALATCLRLRSEFTRDALVPRDDAVATLEELKRRGFRRGVISVCSSDVEEIWDETELAPHVDDVVLSCAVGLRKPDPRIYELACERLDVKLEECLFVGDGANDELAGAQRVGMSAVCVLPPGRSEPLWPEARGWEPTVSSLRDVLALV